MKIVLLTLFLAVTVLTQEHYDDHDFDISELLSNERLLKSYAKCLLNQGACTPEVKELKDKLPEALATHCAKCTERQKQSGKQLAKEVKKNHPDIWTQLVAMYDPKGKYQQTWKEFLQE